MTRATSQARSVISVERLPLIALTLLLLLVPLATSKLWGEASFTVDRFQLPKMALVAVLVVAGLFAWLHALVGSGGVVRNHHALWMLGGLFGWYALTTVTSIDWRTSLGGSSRWEGVFSLVVYIGLVFLTLQVATSPAKQRTLVLYAIAGGTLVALYAVAQQLGLDPVDWRMSEEGAGRVFATYGNPDFLGGYLVFPFVAAVGLAFDEGIEASRRRLLPFAAAVMAVALVLTRVRGAWIGALAGLVLVGLALWLVRGGLRTKEWIAVGVAALLVAGAVAASGAGAAVVAKMTSAEGGGGFLSGRTEIWRVAALAVKDSPVLGSGPDTMQWAYGRARDRRNAETLGPEFVADAAHNHPLQLAATVGFPGALLFIAFGVWALLSGIRAAFRGAGPPEARLVTAVVVACYLATSTYLLSGIALPGIMPFFWVGAACCLAPSARSVRVEPWRSPLVVQATAAACAVVVLSYASAVVWGDHLARVGLTNEDPVAGVSALQRAAALSPLRVGYDVELGKVARVAMRGRVTAGDIAAAQAHYGIGETALLEHIEQVPWDPAGYAELAYVYNDASALGLAKSLDRADTVAARGLDRFPYNMDLLKQRAAALFNQRRPQDAEPLIDTALELDPEDVDALLMRAQLYDATGRASEARQWFRRVLDIEPENEAAKRGLEGPEAD